MSSICFWVVFVFHAYFFVVVALCTWLCRICFTHTKHSCNFYFKLILKKFRIFEKKKTKLCTVFLTFSYSISNISLVSGTFLCYFFWFWNIFELTSSFVGSQNSTVVRLHCEYFHFHLISNFRCVFGKCSFGVALSLLSFALLYHCLILYKLINSVLSLV